MYIYTCTRNPHRLFIIRRRKIGKVYSSFKYTGFVNALFMIIHTSLILILIADANFAAGHLIIMFQIVSLELHLLWLVACHF
jgi:hypothetical protein